MIRRGLLVSSAGPAAAKRAVDLGCESLHPDADHTNEKLLGECRSRELKVFPYTVNDPGRMKHLLAIGVDGLYTDFPGRLAEIADASGHPRPQRQPRAPEPGRSEPPAPTPAGDIATWRRRGRRGPAHPKPPVSETWAITPERVSLDPIDAGSAIVTEAPEGSPATGNAEVRKKRRRGKRGGRRHRRGASKDQGRDETASTTITTPSGEAGEPASAAETEAFEPDEDSEDDATEPAAGTAAAGRTDATVANGETNGTEAAAGDQPGRKKRRRGRRGGRRHRERRLRKEKAAGGESPEPGPEPDPTNDEAD